MAAGIPWAPLSGTKDAHTLILRSSKLAPFSSNARARGPGRGENARASSEREEGELAGDGVRERRVRGLDVDLEALAVGDRVITGEATMPIRACLMA